MSAPSSSSSSRYREPNRPFKYEWVSCVTSGWGHGRERGRRQWQWQTITEKLQRGKPFKSSNEARWDINYYRIWYDNGTIWMSMTEMKCRKCLSSDSFAFIKQLTKMKFSIFPYSFPYFPELFGEIHFEIRMCFPIFELVGWLSGWLRGSVGAFANSSGRFSVSNLSAVAISPPPAIERLKRPTPPPTIPKNKNINSNVQH